MNCRSATRATVSPQRIKAEPCQAARTKVRWQQQHRDKVQRKGDNLGEHDQQAPRANGEGDVDELRENQRREGDRHDVEQARLEQQDREHHDDRRLVDRQQRPLEEGLDVERAALLQLLVELGEREGVGLLDVLVEHQRKHGRHRVPRRVAHEQPAGVDCHGCHKEDGREDGLDERDDQAAMDDELHMGPSE